MKTTWREQWFKLILAVCAIAITLTIVIPPVARMFHEEPCSSIDCLVDRARDEEGL